MLDRVDLWIVGFDLRWVLICWKREQVFWVQNSHSSRLKLRNVVSIIVYLLDPRLIDLILSFLFQSYFNSSLLILVMQKFVVLLPAVNCQNFFIFICGASSKWGRLMCCRTLSDFFLICNLLINVWLGRSCSWNLSYFLWWFWNFRVNLVMIALPIIRLFESSFWSWL